MIPALPSADARAPANRTVRCMRIAVVQWSLVFAGLACAPISRAPRAAPATKPQAVVGVAAAASPLPLPAGLDRSRAVACTFTAASWPTEDDDNRTLHYLRFEPGGPPFASVYDGTDVKLELPVGSATAGGMLTLHADGVVVQGRLEAAEMPLYPASAFVLSHVFVPNYERRLVWRSSGKPGVMTVAAEAMPRLRPIDGELSAERECKDIALGRVIFEDDVIDQAMHAKRAPAATKLPRPWLRSGKVTLSPEPEGDAVVEIDVVEPRDDRLLISPPRVLEVQKGRTRIAVRTYGGVVFGWAPSEQIVQSRREYLDLSHDAVNYLVRRRLPGPPLAVCSHDVLLVAEVANERRLVGTLGAGTRFERGASRAGWTRIELRDAGVVAAEGASFMVRESDLVDCRLDSSRQNDGGRG